MYNTDQPKETARKRAARIWHNHAIIRDIQAKGQYTIIDDNGQPDWEKKNKTPTSIRREILGIFAKQSNDTIRNYIISINERRKKLLREKLRRLKAEHGDE